MVLHDMNQAIRYSDRIIVMKEGRIVGEGAPESVMTEEMIMATYQVKVAVKSDEQSGLYMVPVGI
ncbi:ABC transporter ATP-binding protein [Paenibacillus paeoniae]|uniref:ABC transporter ATP-binding protein n=1 Tax=Paenibacillus paeoniae TaxID=2292705 RepID=A0A371P6J9_9BACL|nr:ABC transporter ATP-binding protein [Paenibacillus paeoniae]